MLQNAAVLKAPAVLTMYVGKVLYETGQKFPIARGFCLGFKIGLSAPYVYRLAR